MGNRLTSCLIVANPWRIGPHVPSKNRRRNRRRPMSCKNVSGLTRRQSSRTRICSWRASDLQRRRWSGVRPTPADDVGFAIKARVGGGWGDAAPKNNNREFIVFYDAVLPPVQSGSSSPLCFVESRVLSLVHCVTPSPRFLSLV